MKFVIDNQIAKRLSCGEAVPEINDFDTIIFKWPTLLEFLNFHPMSLLKKFDETNLIFEACLESLHKLSEKEHLYHVYDTLFAETINEIKSLKKLRAAQFIEKIESCLDENKQLINGLETFKSAFLVESSKTMHDLILYLSFDRMCFCLSKFFDYQTKSPVYIENIKVLRECLVDSYMHIQLQKKTFLSFYTLMESLFFFEMREENLKGHTDDEWEILKKTFSILNQKNELAGFFYIDDAIYESENLKKEFKVSYLTSEPKDLVQLRLSFAKLMIKKIQHEIIGFQYTLNVKEIIYSKQL